jgi:hypothetical protein
MQKSVMKAYETQPKEKQVGVKGPPVLLARAFWTMSPPIISRREKMSEGLVHWEESWSEVLLAEASLDALFMRLFMVVVEGLRLEIRRRMGMVDAGGVRTR